MLAAGSLDQGFQIALLSCARFRSSWNGHLACSPFDGFGELTAGVAQGKVGLPWVVDCLGSQLQQDAARLTLTIVLEIGIEEPQRLADKYDR